MGILLLALGLGALLGAGEGGVEFRWTTEPVSGWLCTGPNPSASLVMVHSTAQPRGMSEPMARAVARRGFRSFVPTPGGNPLLNAITLDEQREQVVKSVAWCREKGPVFLAGHSVGANQAVLAADQCNPDGVIALGYDVEASPKRSWSLLLAAGVYDQLHPASQVQEVLGQATGQSKPLPGQLYGNAMFLLSPLSDHHNEALDPVLLGAAADWAGGQPPRNWSVESLRVAGAVLISAGLFCLGLALRLHPVMALILLGLSWWSGGADLTGETRFHADVMLAVGMTPLVARSLRALALLTMAWASWTLTAVLNGLPGLWMQPGSLAYLPLFVPWTAVTDSYQLRAVAQALLVPWAPLGVLVLELVCPGSLGRALGTWIVGLARAVATFQLNLTVKGSGTTWLALLMTLGVAGLAWVRVLSEGYDFNLTSLLSLLGLLMRVALLPLGLMVLMLRTPWARGLLTDTSNRSPSR
ncbi:MAG: hypothetical protein AB1758_24050 [Candidatus Eremiobacterota bacterium]